ncbi:calpain clp-1 [Aplysia californica]|uniref:Calpain clp-1 n=1 Tax=Aplysia californica TaxID=6500 RepID=A0ABM0ZVJ1_APLCA|nr:calpain clp-1 [Aplysia californica]
MSSGKKKSSDGGCLCCCDSDEEDSYDPYIPKPSPDSDKTKYETIRRLCLNTNTLYEDPDFRPDSSNLNSSGIVNGVLWKRPHQITPNPVYIHQGADYMDVDQGQYLGDCWFLTAVVCLAASDERYLLNRVVPSDQDFYKDYCGAFRFRFWYRGRWVEVVVDDRLPTYNGRLIYGSNRSVPSEYWLPLLEKAYAKLYGGYQDIHLGYVDVALENLTGGVVELAFFDRRLDHEKFNQGVLKFHKMNSFMSAFIKKEKNMSPQEIELPTGLYAGHAYSIIDVIQVDTTNGLRTLLHVRNPWGFGEWNGPWSDGSPEWHTIIGPDRNRNFRVRDDGEFWMSLEDFMGNFTGVAIAHLNSDEITTALAANLHRTPWRMKELEGTRNYKGSSKGGHKHGGSPGKPPPKRSKAKGKRKWSNPQLELRLPEAKTPTYVVVSLVESNSRAVCEEHAPDPIFLKREKGKQVHRIKPEHSCEIHPCCDESSGRAKPFVSRTAHFLMGPNDRVIVPCFIRPDTQAEFLFRVFCEEEVEITVVEDPIEVTEE